MAENTVVGSFNIFDNSVAVIKNSSSPLDYLFRYRLITDEGEALSEWSRVNELTQESISGIMNGFVSSVSVSSVESGGTGINVGWTIPNNFPTNKFDVYFSWSYNDGLSFTDFEYADTVISNNYYIDIPFNGSVIEPQVPTGTTNITIKTAKPHNISVGGQATISGVTPIGYNGTWTAQTGTTGSTLIVNIGSNPGTLTAAGKVLGTIRAGLVKVAVQVPTNIKIINTNALLIQSSAKSTLPILDPGTIV